MNILVFSHVLLCQRRSASNRRVRQDMYQSMCSAKCVLRKTLQARWIFHRACELSVTASAWAEGYFFVVPPFLVEAPVPAAAPLFLPFFAGAFLAGAFLGTSRPPINDSESTALNGYSWTDA